MHLILILLEDWLYLLLKFALANCLLKQSCTIIPTGKPEHISTIFSILLNTCIRRRVTIRGRINNMKLKSFDEPDFLILLMHSAVSVL
jgi:hypothetical protein